ncbi:MAG: hypothetical protein WBE48_29215 [Xanthobacteraceae bacterium]
MLRCYAAVVTKLPVPAERVEFPFRGVAMPGRLRKRGGVERPPVGVILPGLDACKEELHAWAEAFVDRGMAALTLDGPGQGETSFHLPTSMNGVRFSAMLSTCSKGAAMSMAPASAWSARVSAPSTRRSPRPASRG